MEPNLNKFPNLARYIGSLPYGLMSYPASTTRSNFSLILRPHLAPYLNPSILPQNVLNVLNSPWKTDEWIPEVAYVALSELARDVLWKSDEEFHRGMFTTAMEMYKGPFLKAFFAMLGPSIVVMSAAKRWNTLHQGSTMAVKKQHKESVDLILDYPENIFSLGGMKSLGAAICGAIEVSRGKESSFVISSLGDTHAELTIHWKYWTTS